MFKVSLVTDGLTETEERMVKRASLKVELVFNSDKFKEWVINYSYSEQRCTGRPWRKKCTTIEHINFNDCLDLSNKEVYCKIMEGKEALGETGEGSDADIFLRVDRRNRSGVIGYTYQNTPWQYVYQWVLRDFTVDDVAANLAHEWCHKLGFDHSYSFSTTRQYSVPYAVGYFVGGF